MTAVRVTARQLTAHDYFVSNNYHTYGAGAFVGNGCGESGENLDSTFDRVHADHGSGGFLEWRDSHGSPRKTKLAEFADARGQNPGSDLITQCAYAIWELENDFPSLNDQLKNPGTRSIANLTANFCFIFENPAKATAGLDNRIAHAESVVARAAEIKAAPAPQPAPPEPVPQVPAPTEPPPQVPLPAPPAGLPPVLPSQAGRTDAMVEMLYRAREDRVAELEAADPEIRVIDKALAAFGDFQQAHTSPAVPPPALPSPVPPAATPTQGKTMTISLPTNWKTTLSGIIAAASSGIGAAYPQYQWLTSWLTPLALGALGLTAKDSTTTGGTVAATPEAAKRIANQ